MTRPQADAQGERDAIVRWLRSPGSMLSIVPILPGETRPKWHERLGAIVLAALDIADAIKRGEHQPLTRKE